VEFVQVCLCPFAGLDAWHIQAYYECTMLRVSLKTCEMKKNKQPIGCDAQLVLGNCPVKVWELGRKFSERKNVGSLFPSAYLGMEGSIFTALHGMQTRSSDEKAVCPSV